MRSHGLFICTTTNLNQFCPDFVIELRLRMTIWNLYNRMTGRLEMRSDRDSLAREV